MIHLYFGDGKGKTTAAMGMALRAVAAGNSVVIVQFLKSRASGEIRILESMPGVNVFRGKAGYHFTNQMTDEERQETFKISNRNFMKAVGLCKSGFCQYLVLDEICAAWNENLINRKLVEDFLNDVNDNFELVLTGRNPPQCFFDVADYVTEMKKIKHPIDKGIMAREGVEY